MVRAEEGKSPVKSLIMSAIIPGLGQYYNGTTPEVIKGSIQTLGCLTGVLLFLDAPIDAEYGYGYQRLGGFSLFAACWLFSVIDAPICSADINGEATNKHAASDFKMRLTLLNNPAFRLVPAAEVSLKF